jgi:hypothetical protein
VQRKFPLLIALCAISVALAQPPADERPDLLKALDGGWVMTGDVLGKPVTYDLEAGATLQDAFTELHMKDVHLPAEYEARVFIGWDAGNRTVIVHWLDSFGGKYSIPHGTGQIAGNVLEFTIAYADGPFRDTLTYDPQGATWRFVIEAGQKDGTWKHFAQYDIRRK